MTKEEAIKHLHTYSSTNGSGLTTQDQHEEAKKMAIKALETQPGWIPVTERLPENDNDVLVTDGTDCAVAYWRTDAQAWDDSMHGWCDLYGLEVVAWMPLPKPWKNE